MALLPTKTGLGSKSDAEQIQCALLNHGWLSKHIEDGEAVVGGLNSVFDDGREIAEERLKAVDLGAVSGVFGKGLEFGGGGALGGSDDGGSGSLCLQLVIIVEKDGGQELAHMPLHVVGQHTK
jgi:hypothetical protein